MKRKTSPKTSPPRDGYELKQTDRVYSFNTVGSRLSHGYEFTRMRRIHYANREFWLNELGQRSNEILSQSRFYEPELPLWLAGKPVEGNTKVFESRETLVEALPTRRKASRLRIHRAFARIEFTPSSVLSFADEYGLLGHKFYVAHDSEDRARSHVEHLLDWFIEILKVKKLCALIDALRTDSIGQLDWFSLDLYDPYSCVDQRFLSFENKVLSIDIHGLTLNLDAWGVSAQRIPFVGMPTRLISLPNYLKGRTERGSELPERRPMTVEDLAAYVIQYMINEQLAKNTSMRLAFNNLDPSRPILVPVGDNLLGDIYFSLAQEFFGDIPVERRCLGCSAVFNPNRKDQVYHDKNCQKSHNKRFRRALKRQSGGSQD